MPESRHRKISKRKRQRSGSRDSRYNSGPKFTLSKNVKTGILVFIGAVVLGVAAYYGYSYLKRPKMITTASGLQYSDEKVGTGATPQKGQTITVNYRGVIQSTGKEFDSSEKHGGSVDFPIGIGRVIKGWDEGIMTMKVGGKRHLIIPGDLAYEKSGRPPDIPPNATLVFDVELLGVK
ncbi:MAG TPA: FKBP-type peptidyl-prolyl cis-trans isomerase [Pyrinomonadaceae bacterium]